MTRLIALFAGAAIVGVGAVTSAAAGADFGSAIIVTDRSCAGVNSATACDGSGPGQQILWPAGSPFGTGSPPYGSSVLTGGDMLSASGSFTGVDGSNTAGVTFNTANSEPVFSGSTDSLGDVRYGSNGVSYYTYTNSGGVAVALSISASIAFDSSTASPAVPDGQDLPGGAEYDAFVAITDPAYLAANLSGPGSAAYGLGLSPGDAFDYDMIFGLLFTTCGPSGVDAYGYASSPTTGGAGGTGVSSSACSGGGAYTVAPGQTVIIMDGYQLITNRGGEIDPLTLTYTSAPTPNPLTVPEPAEWVLMLSGVAFVGGALRRRARLEKLTA